CAPWMTFAVLRALAAQLSLPSIREFGDLRSQNYFWNIWLTPVGTIVSTLWLLYLWRRPFKPKPIQAPGSDRVDGVRASRLKDASVQQHSGFQGFVKSLFL
ncbi:MAG: hypothetical protein P1V35_11915, partial [Planctomycetota bacterium]|nr:hypothetical protein [Planctomycetota bacterium]